MFHGGGSGETLTGGRAFDGGAIRTALLLLTKRLATNRRRAFAAITFVVALAYADLFTSGLGCTSSLQGGRTDAGMIDDLSGMADLSASRDMSAAVDMSTTSDMSVPPHDATVKDSAEDSTKDSAGDSAMDSEKDSETDVHSSPPDAAPDGSVFIDGWQCATQSDCPDDGGPWGWACCSTTVVGLCVSAPPYPTYSCGTSNAGEEFCAEPDGGSSFPSNYCYGTSGGVFSLCNPIDASATDRGRKHTPKSVPVRAPETKTGPALPPSPHGSIGA
jgi:hypothetical protein